MILSELLLTEQYKSLVVGTQRVALPTSKIVK
jgi:hypothetical protein